MKYRKKPVVIEAVQWDGSNINLIFALGGTREIEQEFTGDKIKITTLEGVMTANKLDWIIKGVGGELYPCKPDIFKITYTKVNEGTEMSKETQYQERLSLLKNLLIHVRDEMAKSLHPESPEWFPQTEKLIEYLEKETKV